MNKKLAAALMAGSLSLTACASVDDARYQDVGTGAAVGALGGAAVGAVVGGVSPIEGAVVGAAIGGLTGAVWSDANNDGYADGYTYNGNYYQGQPQGYNRTLGNVATGAVGGAALGAAAGAVIPGVSVLEGAIAGAVVGRVVSGIEHLASLPRGTEALGFYKERSSDMPIASVRLASDLPEAGRPKFEYLDETSRSFAAWLHVKKNRRDDFYIRPAGGVDLCNAPVPVRPVG